MLRESALVLADLHQKAVAGHEGDLHAREKGREHHGGQDGYYIIGIGVQYGSNMILDSGLPTIGSRWSPVGDGLGGGRWPRRDRRSLSAACRGSHVGLVEEAPALGVADLILRHGLVAAEVAALEFAVGRLDMGEDVGVELVLALVPVELLARILHALGRTDAHAAAEHPAAQLVVIDGAVAGDVAQHALLLVKLRQQDALVEGPARGVAVLVDLPALGDDAILDDAGVGDERVDAVGRHDGHGVAVVDGGGGVLLGLVAARGQDPCQHEREHGGQQAPHALVVVSRVMT